MLRLGRSQVDLAIDTLMMTDSLEMTDAERAVYVAMNGRCFDWNRVRKNRETGVFEAI